MTAHPIADAIGPTLTDWLDTDEHRDQAYRLHQRITAHHGPYIAAAWLIGAGIHATRTSTAPTTRAEVPPWPSVN